MNPLGRLSRRILPALERWAAVLFRPFANAADLGQYANRGYFLLGGVLACCLAGLWISGVLSTPIRDPDSTAAQVLTLILKVLHLEAIAESPLPLTVAIAVIYVALGAVPVVRHTLGEGFALAVFWILDQAVSASEWCIEHRWTSLVLVMTLVVTLSASFFHLWQLHSNETVLRDDYRHWVELASEFTTKSGLSGQYVKRYSPVHAQWRDGFKTLLKSSESHGRAALALNSMLDSLELNPAHGTWDNYLLEREARLEPILRTQLGPWRASWSDDETTCWVLAKLVAGRLCVRLARPMGTEAKELVAGLRTFQELTRDSVLHRIKDRSVLSAAYNGLGTAYASTAIRLLRHGADSTSRADEAELKKVGGDLNRCILAAFDNYSKAQAGFDECAFEVQRSRNNRLDLMIRVAGSYAEGGRLQIPVANRTWLGSRTDFAERMMYEARQLLACIRAGEPFEPTFLATAAQAYVAAARLRRADGADDAAAMREAGTLLRLAYGFVPEALDPFDFLPFESALRAGGGLDSNFVKGFSETLEALPAYSLKDLEVLMRGQAASWRE